MQCHEKQETLGVLNKEKCDSASSSVTIAQEKNANVSSHSISKSTLALDRWTRTKKSMERERASTERPLLEIANEVFTHVILRRVVFVCHYI